MKTVTLESKKNVQKMKNSHVKNVNNHKNHYSPVKIESKKQAKKVIAERKEFGWEFLIEHLGFSHVPPTITLGISAE